jgi:hypothetical protein
MALLSRQEIEAALERLGQIAAANGQTLHLVVIGGAAMVLGYDARPATRDIDAFLQAPPEPQEVRKWVRAVADELGWPEEWLNDAAKGYLMGVSEGPILLQAPGIEVRQPAPEQLLAMKLCAWRDDTDISDATRLLTHLEAQGSKDEIWMRLEPYLLPGRELKAQYAFDDVWETLHGDD